MRTLGEYLIEAAVLTAAQVESALARQRADAARGERKLFGSVIVEMGLATDADVKRALDLQRGDRT